MGIFSSIGDLFKKAAPVVGGMIGGPAGAFLGAAVVSGLSRICRRKVPPRGEHGDHAAGSDS